MKWSREKGVVMTGTAPMGGSTGARIAALADPGTATLEFLAGADKATLSPAGLVDAVIASERLLAHVNALQAGLLAELGRPGRAGDVSRLVQAMVDKAGQGRGATGEVDAELVAELTRDRAVGMAATQVAAVLDWAPTTARIRIDQATDLISSLPNTFAALTKGRIDVGRTRMIIDRTTVLDAAGKAEVERVILPLVKGRSKARLETQVDRAVIIADPTAADKRAAKAKKDRAVVHRPDKDGMGIINALLPAESAVMVFTLVNLIADAHAGLDGRTADQRRADALADIADQLLTDGYVDLTGLTPNVWGDNDAGPAATAAGASTASRTTTAEAGAGYLPDESTAGASAENATTASRSGGLPAESPNTTSTVNAADESSASPAARATESPAATAAAAAAAAAKVHSPAASGKVGIPSETPISAGTVNAFDEPSAHPAAEPAESPATSPAATAAAEATAHTPGAASGKVGIPSETPISAGTINTPNSARTVNTSDKTSAAATASAESEVNSPTAHSSAPDTGPIDKAPSAPTGSPCRDVVPHSSTRSADNPGRTPRRCAGPAGPGNLARTLTRHGRRPHLVVTGALSTLAGLDDLPGHLDGHGTITADLLRAIAKSWGTVTAVGVDPATGTGAAVGALIYRPRQQLTDQILMLAGTCRMVGCRQPAWRCEIDHVDPFNHQNHAAGGQTSSTNLEVLCKWHHLLKHHTDWRPTVLPNQTIRWMSPTGHESIDHPREFTLPGEWDIPSKPGRVDGARAQPLASDEGSEHPPVEINRPRVESGYGPEQRRVVGAGPQPLQRDQKSDPGMVNAAGTARVSNDQGSELGAADEFSKLDDFSSLEDPCTVPRPGTPAAWTYRVLRQDSRRHTIRRLRHARTRDIDPKAALKRAYIQGLPVNIADEDLDPATLSAAILALKFRSKSGKARRHGLNRARNSRDLTTPITAETNGLPDEPPF